MIIKNKLLIKYLYKLFTLLLLFIIPNFALSQASLIDPAKADSYYAEGRIVEALYIYKNIKLNNNTKSNDIRIAEIEKQLEDEAKAKDLFQQCIINGNSSLKLEDYESAYISFKASLLIRPEANFPKSKLRTLAEHVQDPMIEKQFEIKKKEGDSYFEQAKYEKASVAYDEALVIKPQDKYILAQKLRIEEISIQMAELKKQYDTKIIKADQLFENKEYEAAMIAYEEATALVPAENYPNEKIAEINNIYKERADLEKQYNSLIAEADSAFFSEEYEKAKVLFSQAVEIKPEQEYPNGRLNAINEILANNNAKDNEIKLIRENIAITIEAEQFNIALSHIQSGLRLLPNDTEFVKQKEYVEAVLAERKLNEMNYSNFVSRADEFFRNDNYEQALRYYERAKQIKSTEEIDQKIINANKLLEIQIEDYEKKTTLVADSVKADIENEKTAVNSSTIIKNNESTLSEKINIKTKEEELAVKSFVNEEDKLNYEAAIKRGDLKFSRQNYEAAKKEYSDALKYNPGKRYPQKMIKQIDELIAQHQQVLQEQKEIEQKADEERMKLIEEMSTKSVDSNKSLAEGISFYNSKQYDKAIEKLDEALKADPSSEASQYREKIIKLFDSNVSRVLTREPLTLTATKLSFNFDKLTILERSNTYIAITLSNSTTSTPKVFLNFYADKVRKGGMVFKELTENLSHKPIYVKVSDIMVWKREDINKVELFSENGESKLIKLEIISIQ